MRIEFGNVWAKVTQATTQERRWLDEYLTVHDQQSAFNGGWPLRLFNTTHSSIPSGLVGMVKKAAREDKQYHVEVFDRRICTAKPNAATDLTWLRDYQIDAVHKCWGATRGIIHAPTGSGKTEIFAALCKSVNIRWLLIAHRTDLVAQATERILLRTGEQAGFIGNGKWDPRRITCATFQTLCMNLKEDYAKKFLASIEGIVVDECHVAPANSYRSVLMATPSAYWRFGLSGTPLDRSDRRSIIAVGALGRVIYRIRPDTLIAAGVLAKPTIYMSKVFQPISSRDWRAVYKQGITESLTRNERVLADIKRAAKPCLVFVKEIEHGRLLERMVRSAGYNVEFIWGAADLSRRKGAVKRLEHGDRDVVVASVVWQEGIDIPNLSATVIAAGGKSVIATLQRIGRGMRTGPDGKKKGFEVYDYLDLGNRWLERHSRARVSAYQKEGYEVTTT